MSVRAVFGFVAMMTLSCAPSVIGDYWGEDLVADGDYRVFVTSTTHQGHFGVSGAGGFSRANQICQDRAQAGGLTREYQAFLGSSLSQLKDRFLGSGALYVVCGSQRLRVAPKISALWVDAQEDESILILESPLQCDEFGNTLSPTRRVWTGSRDTGGDGVNHCYEWSVNLGGSTGVFGSASEKNYRWIAEAGLSCSSFLSLYCISK
jgi:hypothetical protein